MFGRDAPAFPCSFNLASSPMTDMSTLRSVTVPSLPKSFPPGGTTLEILAFPSRAAATAAADSVAAVHGTHLSFKCRGRRWHQTLVRGYSEPSGETKKLLDWVKSY